ncbi:MAG: L-serine ammonia-lyase [Ruminococcaceae bacterium]|nr:L-serine ammonia-lyase [Oscillospiraceae bacterium]
MESIREIYKKGRGPSSSHTMGPFKAAKIFWGRYPSADRFRVILYGSLALTGKGHMTDSVIRDAFSPLETEIVFDKQTPTSFHPNTADFFAYQNGKQIGQTRVYSIGGGSILFEGESLRETRSIYPYSTFREISRYCVDRNMRLCDFVEEIEGREIWSYLADVWETMKRSIHEGLSTCGELGGDLHVMRKAHYLYNQRHIDESAQTKENRLVCAYAFAVSEQNASGGEIVTAPTCGACGVLPAVLKYMQKHKGFSDEQILRALSTGGLIGNLIKTNASISGAECGCQAEIGSACSMAAAALGELFGMGIEQIEYAAEVAMEHHLGLTCDPIRGLVQIPCIERNAVAAMRAINALSLANFLTAMSKISFDTVVKTMYETGIHLKSEYRETSEGGLAKHYIRNQK